jgi:hypothetical protein
MKRAALRGDVAAAVLISLFIVVILAPGLAVVGMIAILILVLTAVSVVVGQRRRRRRGQRDRARR